MHLNYISHSYWAHSITSQEGPRLDCGWAFIRLRLLRYTYISLTCKSQWFTKPKKVFELVIRCDVCGKEDTRDIIECTSDHRFCSLCRDKHEIDLFDIKKSKNHSWGAFHHVTRRRNNTLKQTQGVIKNIVAFLAFLSLLSYFSLNICTPLLHDTIALGELVIEDRDKITGQRILEVKGA